MILDSMILENNINNYYTGLPWSVVKNLTANARDIGSVLGPGRSLGEGNSNPLQYSCLDIPMDRRAWRAAVQGS